MANESHTVQSDRNTLSSAWETFCVNHEGKNIKNTIVQLLNMYRPEDGIEAYERVLKTLTLLLEDCNNNDLRSFASMIPLPLGVPQHIIREVFFNATGFTKIDCPIFQQDCSYFPHGKNIVKNKDKSKAINKMFEYSTVEANNYINSETVSAPGVTNQHIVFSQKPFFDHQSFQEMNVPIQTHDKNAQYPYHFGYNYDSSQNYFLKPQPNSSSLPPTGCQKTWNMNHVPLFVKNCNTVQSNFPYRSLLVKTMNNKYLRLPISVCNMQDVHYVDHYQNQESSEKEKNLFNAYDLSKNTTQRTIEVPEVSNDVEYNNSSKKKELNNFKEYNYQSVKKKKLKRNDEKESHQIFLPFADKILETLTVNKNLKVCIENFLNRLKQDMSAQEPIDNTKRINPYMEVEKSSLSRYQKPRSSPVSQRKNNLQNETNTFSSRSAYQTNSINELTAHKQQYYDALLNVQRAKLAVANSLTLSTAHDYGDFDSFYTNCGHQRHWTTQQLQAKAIHESPNCPKLFHSHYSQANDSYVRTADWNSSSRVRQELPFTHTSSSYGSRYIYNIPNDPNDTSQYSNLSSQSKTNVKRRKLNNTTVKLMKGNTNSMHY